MSTAPRSAYPVKKHIHEVRWRIIAPVALTLVALIGLCIALAIGVAAGSLESQQITIVMGVLATVFISLPLTLLCLVPYVLLVVSAHLSYRGYARARTPLRAVRHGTERIAQATEQHVPPLARPLIGLNVRLTRWEHRLRGLLPALPAEKDVTHE